MGPHLRRCPHPSSGAPPAQFSETCPERGRGAWTSPQPRGETKRRTLTQPAAPLRAGGETLGPPGLPLPAALPPTLTCSRKSPNTDTISTPEACGQEARPLVTAAQVGAHSGMWGDRRKGGRAPRAAEAPRPPPRLRLRGPARHYSLPDAFPDSSSARSPPSLDPRVVPGRPYRAGLPAPGGHPLPAHFRILGTERKDGGGQGPAGAGGRAGGRRAITRSASRAQPAAGVSAPFQSLGRGAAEGTQGPSLFLGLHEGEVKGGI